jgi:hypothetical protein
MNQRPALGGPQPVSLSGMVATFGQVLGQAGMEPYDKPILVGETARASGVQLTPFESVVRHMLGRPAA